MATIKAYTDLEQSKKLAEILPLESADMEYMFLKKDGSKVSNVPFVKDGFEEPECCYTFIPCWSLSALLDVLPEIVSNESLFIETYAALWHIGYRNIYAARAANLVDACYEMILKLHELNLL